MKRFLPCWNILLGGMDAVTGVCLIAMPAWTLRTMGIQRPPSDLVLASYIGVFVLAVGLAYFLTIRPPSDAESHGRWVAVWKFTALARLLVAAFVAWKVASGVLEPAWLTVALADGATAASSVLASREAGSFPADPNMRREIAAIAALTLSFGFFLLFAQFAFIELAKVSVINAVMLKSTMAAMALAGIVASFLTPALVRRFGSVLVVRAAFLACAFVAALAPSGRGLAVFIMLAAGTGASVGALTVSLAAALREAIPIVRGGWIAGWGTGLAYGLCNVPWVFQAAPARQSAIAALAALLGAGVSFGLGQSNRPEKWPPYLLAEPRDSLATVVLCFLALVWLDSAAFFIIQQTRELKLATWASGDLWRNAGVHLLSALFAGWLLTRLGWRGVVLLGFLVLASAALMVDHAPLRHAAGWLYPAGASMYSSALLAWPAFLSGSANGWEAARRAAWLFAIAGWVGSANGIGMAESLQRVPPLFVGIAAAVLLLGIHWRRVSKHAIAATLIVATSLAVEAWGRVRADPSSLASEEDRLKARLLAGDSGIQALALKFGRQVYLREGCMHCHSRYVRPDQPESLVWGPASSPQAVAREVPPLIGNRRQGPDLTWVGARRSATWLRLHFLDPRSFAPSSSMPSYARLFDGQEGQWLIAYLRHQQEEAVAARLASDWRPTAVAAGEDELRLFARHCAVCHGTAGQGDGKWAREFAKPPANLRDGPFVWSPTEGADPLEVRLARLIKFGIVGTDMPGHETLPDDAVVALARWVEQRRAQPQGH